MNWSELLEIGSILVTHHWRAMEKVSSSVNCKPICMSVMVKRLGCGCIHREYWSSPSTVIHLFSSLRNFCH